MPCLFHYTLRSHICRRHTIVWLLELWIWCCLSKLLSLQPIVGFLSRDLGPVCASTGVFVGPTSFLFLEYWRVDLGSTSMLLWCELHDWACQWGILACLYLFSLKLGMNWCFVPRPYPFIAGVIPVYNGSVCPSLDRFYAQQAGLIPRSCVVRGFHLLSGVRQTDEVWIWCQWSINLRSWHAPHSMGCQW